MGNGNFEFWGFKKVGGHYDVINGGQRKKNDFFRPDVTFGVDAQWLLHRFKDEKKISRDRPSGSLLPPFRVRYCPCGLREGGSKMGQSFNPHLFAR